MQTHVVGDNSLLIYDHDRPINDFSYDTKDSHKYTKTVNTRVSDDDPDSGQKYILMINQAVQISGLANHHLCPMWCHLSSVQIHEVSKFLADSPSETFHAMQVVHPHDTVYTLKIPL